MLRINLQVLRIFVFFISLSTLAQVESTFEERAERHIADVAGIYDLNSGYKQVFAIASANFYQYKITGESTYLDKARQLVVIGHNSIDEMNFTEPNLDISFGLWMGMDCFLRWSEYYTDQLKVDARYTFTQSKHYNNHGTSNKQLMASSARLLASLQWPNDTFASGYNTGDNNSSGGIVFANICNKYVRQGENEFNSPTYYAFHYGPMRSVADFAPDALVTETNGQAYNFKKIASLTAEWMLASSAVEWLDGHWIAPTQRLTINQSKPQHQYVMGDLVMRLYFGGPYGGDADGNFENFRAYGSIIPAVSNYRVPKIYQDIASHTDNAGFTAYERKLLEFGIYKVNYYITTFKMPEYGVFSNFEVSESENNDPRFTFGSQQVRWGIYWKDASSNDSGFVLKHELDPTNALQPGVSQYEHVSQNKGTIVGVYKIPNNDPIPYIKGYIPNSYDAFIDNSSAGQIYLKYDDILIGLHLSESFNWINGDETFNKNTSKLGFVVETAKASTYTGTDLERLIAFKQDVQPGFLASQFAIDNVGLPSMEYTSLEGTTIKTNYRTRTEINNNVVDYTTRKLINNPWMQQDYDGTELNVNYNDTYINYDFENFIKYTNGVDETDDGIAIEAENFDFSFIQSDPISVVWEIDNAEEDYSGSGYVVVKNASGAGPSGYDTSNKLVYNFNVYNGGTYNVWVRRFASDGSDNSAYFGIDNSEFDSNDNSGNYNQWIWKKINTLTLEKGTHQFDLVRREDGYLVDAFLITKGNNDPNNNTLKLNDTSAAAHSDNLLLSPNPTDGILNFDSQGKSINRISIIDAQGRFVNSYIITGENIYQLDMSNLDSAIYFIKISTDSGDIIKQIIKL